MKLDRKTDDQRKLGKVEKHHKWKEKIKGKEESTKRWSTMAITKMVKEAAAVAFMEKTTQRLGESICGIDLARKMAKDKVASLAPFLNGKPLDVNMTCPFSRVAMVNNLNARFVILKDDSRLGSGEVKFV